LRTTARIYNGRKYVHARFEKTMDIHSIIDAALYMRVDFCIPGYLAGVVSLVAFLATFCTTRRPARPCVDLERERGEPAEEGREKLTRPKAPPQDIVQRLAPKRGVMSITFTVHFVL
jgi:hypothetical protein